MIKKADRLTEVQYDEIDAKYDGRTVKAAQPSMARRNREPGDVEWECVFRAPNRQEYFHFKRQCDSSISVDTRSQAQEILARTCIVHVTGVASDPQGAFDALLNRFPGIPESVCGELTKAAGFDAGALEK